MRPIFLALYLSLTAMLLTAGTCLAQPCLPGYSGPVIYGPIIILSGGRQCKYYVHYCVKSWNDALITKYTYDYWLENNGGCSFSAMTAEQIAALYASVSQIIAYVNPAHFQYYPCDLADNETVIDVSHATCVYEEVIEHQTMEDPDIPPTYEYHPCPGAGLCYERFRVCEECLYGWSENPVTGQMFCNQPLPGQPPNPTRADSTDSWAVGDGTTGDCTNIIYNGLERPCYAVCNSDPPGPDLGMVKSGDSPTLLGRMLPIAPQQSVIAKHRYEVKKY